MQAKVCAENPIKKLINVFKDGSRQTRLSFFLPGAGLLLRKQFLKGALYALLTIAFIAYMLSSGGKF